VTDNNQSAEEMLALFADQPAEATTLPPRAARFMRGFFLWGLSLPFKEAKTLVLIMIRIVVAYKKGGMPAVQEDENVERIH
jgi:hypothetical protein